MKFVFATLFSLLTAIRCDAQTNRPVAAHTYKNPVIAGDYADPSVIRVGDTYYAAGTSSEWGPAYPIYTSKDLVNWSYVGPVFAQLPSWTMGSYWAPELFYRKGIFYVYYTARRKTDGRSYIGVATTTDLRNGFTDRGLLLEWTSEAIDAFVVEEAGRLYLTWKAYGLDRGKTIEILGAELAPDGLKVTGNAFTMISADPNGWEAGGAEGQAIVKRGRYYYMIYSGNGCCGPRCNYQVGIARAERLQGPWEKFGGNPVLVGGDAWKCPGHGTLVTTPDNRCFYLHHAYSGTDFTYTGRQGVLSELRWDDQTGWPAFRYGKTPPAEAQAPMGKQQETAPNLSVAFGNQPGNVPWVWDVSLPRPSYTVQDGQLRLASTHAGPAGSFLGLLIKRGTYAFAAVVRPQADVLQSISVYGDAKNAVGLGVRQDSLELWQLKDGVRTVVAIRPMAANSAQVRLELRSRNGQFLHFGWVDNEKGWQAMTERPLDGSFLPRWDRAPRVGVSVSGPINASGQIQAVSMTYN